MVITNPVVSNLGAAADAPPASRGTSLYLNKHTILPRLFNQRVCRQKPTDDRGRVSPPRQALIWRSSLTHYLRKCDSLSHDLFIPTRLCRFLLGLCVIASFLGSPRSPGPRNHCEVRLFNLQLATDNTFQTSDFLKMFNNRSGLLCTEEKLFRYSKSKTFSKIVN